MEILVTVNCSDGALKIKLNDLLEFDYFKKLLNNCSTAMKYEEKTVIKNDVQWTVYHFEIPELTVDCSSKILTTLLKKELEVYYFDQDFLLDLMLFVDMYQITFRISYGGGFNAQYHFGFVLYIKKEVPHLNPFEIIKNGGFIFYTCLLEYGFKSLHQGESDLSEDLLIYLDYYINKEYSAYANYDMIDVLKSIPKLYNHNENKVREIVNTSSIKTMLTNFVINSKGYISWQYNKFNVLFNDFFLALEPLYDIGLVDKEVIGNKDDYLKLLK
jgi:hypothetical protein